MALVSSNELETVVISYLQSRQSVTLFQIALPAASVSIPCPIHVSNLNKVKVTFESVI
jgi:hypothetical protein